MLLDRVYELEGLLLLLEQRNDLPDSFRNLIIEKAKSILAEAQKLEMPNKPEEPAFAEQPDFAEEQNFAETSQIEQEPEPPTATTVTTSATSATTTATSATIRFPLNDRIRFSRELFGGDIHRFDSTIAFVESLPEWPDVEDYFYAELGWDPARPEVAEFTEMLRHLFIMNRK